MDNDIYDRLSYDEKLISEKIGVLYENPMPRVTMTQKLNDKFKGQDMIKQQLQRDIIDEIRKKDAVADANDPYYRPNVEYQKEGMRSGRMNNRNNMNGINDRNSMMMSGYSSDDDLFGFAGNNRVLLFLVVILTIVCLLQYYGNQQTISLMNEILNMKKTTTA